MPSPWDAHRCTARNETDTFAKGFIGGGGLDGGSLDDQDYFAGQHRYVQQAKGSDMVYGTIDVGQRFTLAEGATRVMIVPTAICVQ